MKACVQLPKIYGVLFVASLIWMFAYSGDSWSGFFAVILTTPWSLFVRDISDAISPSLMESRIWWHFTLVFCAGVNGFILFLVGKGLDWVRVRKNTA